MEKQQELEWAEAQKIATSTDLVAAAKQQLRFLAEVDRFRYLYDGPALEWAIYRYKYCWLPLLAKHTKSPVTEGPLVVPLDCEWIWHCHRLNPVRYRNDCKELYGRILGAWNIASSTQAACKKETEECWNRMYPSVPYEMNPSTQLSESHGGDITGEQKSTEYDLVSAVKRQSSFYYQVSSTHMKDNTFLEEAVARYKGFLYLIKRNRERSIKQFSVPTYDIDLIWHSHQLHPVSYCKDLVKIKGRILEHDDTDSDRTKGKKLDTGFSGTTKQWEETFGSRYWKAGAMHRGNAPCPLKICLSELDTSNKKVIASNEHQSMIQLPRKMLVEIMVEIVEVRGLPAGNGGSLSVILSKNQPDLCYRRRMSILSEAGEKDVAVFHCEPTGELIFELMSSSQSVLHIARPAKMLGAASISLHDLLKPGTLSIEKWYEVLPTSGVVGSKPINLRIALSFTSSVQAPILLHLFQTRPCATSCFFPLSGRFRHGKSWTCIVDEDGNEIINLQMRESTKAEAKGNCLSKKQVIGMIDSGETRVLAEFAGTGWFLMDCNWWFQPYEKITDPGSIFELTGSQKVIIFPGKKLEYENGCEKHRGEQNFMTAVQFSAEHPYGKAVVLFDLKNASLKIDEEWMVLPGILLAFLLSDDASGDIENSQLNTAGESRRDMDNDSKQYANASSTEVDKTANQMHKIADAKKVIPQVANTFGGKSDGYCDCGVVPQFGEVAEQGINVITDGRCGEKHDNGLTEIVNSAICVDGVRPVDSVSASLVFPSYAGKCADCGGCGSCHGGCGGCGPCHGGGCHSAPAESGSISLVFPKDGAKSAVCGSCHGGSGGCGPCHGGGCSVEQ